MRRILFIGQKIFGEAAWLKLRKAEGKYKIAAVCSNASAEAVWWRSNRIYQSCGSVPFIDNSDRNEQALIDAILRYDINTLLCAQHPWILSDAVLEAVNYNALNFHNAKLPKYRGCNAINHALLNGDGQFTCTVHWMIDKVDLGDIAFEVTFDIAPDETSLSLYAKCHHGGLRLFDEVISRLERMGEIPRRQMPAGGRFYPRKSIEPLREITGLSAEEMEVKSRAFFFPPFEPAYFRIGGRKSYVLPGNLVELGFDVNNVRALHEMIELAGREFDCRVE
jgi:methionyl-tRNA formyltransferase